MSEHAYPDAEGLQLMHGDSNAPEINQDHMQKEAFYDRTPPEAVINNRTTAYGAYAPDKDGRSGLISDQPELEPDFEYRTSQSANRPRRQWWRRRRICIPAFVIAVALLAIVITVPAVIATRHNSVPASSQHPNDTGPSKNSPSTSGAYNGSGLGSIIPASGKGEALVFFQHFDGGIRQSTLQAGGWTGGDSSTTMAAAANVKNATPIATARYKIGFDETWHVVWLDQNDYLRDAKKINGSGDWTPGVVGAGNFRASSSPTVGLTMSHFGFFVNGTVMDTEGGVRIYYGNKDSLVQEISFGRNSTEWEKTFVFPSDVNGDAGISVSNPNGFAYLFSSSPGVNTLSYYWYDTYLPGNISSTFPHGVWTAAATSAVATLRPNSSLAFVEDKFVLYQTPSNDIIALQPNFSIPAGSWGSAQKVGTGMPATKISAQLGDNPTAWIQDTGDDVTQYLLNGNETPWPMTSVPVD